MIQKRTNCLYCESEMESKTAKKKFCSAKCRIYYRREVARGTLVVSKVGEEILNLMGSNTAPKFTVTKRKQHNHSLTLTVKPNTPPMPTKIDGENSIDFAARKSEWKLKYGQL